MLTIEPLDHRRISLSDVKSRKLQQTIAMAPSRGAIKAYRYTHRSQRRYMLWFRRRKVGVFDLGGRCFCLRSDGPRAAMVHAIEHYSQ